MPHLASPAVFVRWSARLLPWLAGLCALCLAAGFYFSLFASPPDYQQGEAVRIMYVHVPSAWLALSAYTLLAVASGCFLIWKHTLADVIARETAPLGAAFTLICLSTGALWGKPMWGAWWVWDARLTSVLILFFLYISYMALSSSVDYSPRGRKACAWLAVIGFVNIPVIRFSVEWWNTLHQPASLIRAGGVAIDGSMLRPLLLMAAAFTLFFAVILILRVQAALLEHRHRRRQGA